MGDRNRPADAGRATVRPAASTSRLDHTEQGIASINFMGDMPRRVGQ